MPYLSGCTARSDDLPLPLSRPYWYEVVLCVCRYLLVFFSSETEFICFPYSKEGMAAVRQLTNSNQGQSETGGRKGASLAMLDSNVCARNGDISTRQEVVCE